MSEQAAVALASLVDEQEQAEQTVRAALSDLRPPFSQLVQSQLRAGFPLLRSAFVLSAGLGVADSPALLHGRLHLGAAIEVLRLALAVHTRLLAVSDPQAPMDRSVLGSTVLAGDFCFSRSAGLAAKTGSPAVVDIFAQTLQRISEGALRGLFNTSAALFDAERELCLSGVAAANELIGLGEEERRLDQQAAVLLLDGRQAGLLPSTALPPLLTSAWTPVRAARWGALQTWLAAN